LIEFRHQLWTKLSSDSFSWKEEVVSTGWVEGVIVEVSGFAVLESTRSMMLLQSFIEGRVFVLRTLDARI
jgi:hypothetical protein